MHRSKWFLYTSDLPRALSQEVLVIERGICKHEIVLWIDSTILRNTDTRGVASGFDGHCDSRVNCISAVLVLWRFSAPTGSRSVMGAVEKSSALVAIKLLSGAPCVHVPCPWPLYHGHLNYQTGHSHWPDTIAAESTSPPSSPYAAAFSAYLFSRVSHARHFSSGVDARELAGAPLAEMKFVRPPRGDNYSRRRAR